MASTALATARIHPGRTSKTRLSLLVRRRRNPYPRARRHQDAQRTGRARIRLKQAALGLKDIEAQLVTALNTTMHKLRSSHASIGNYETVVNFNQNLLQTQLARLEVGKVESRKVLEVEADLLEARNALAEAKVLYQQALLELELIRGSILQSRDLEVDRRDLKARTEALLRR